MTARRKGRLRAADIITPPGLRRPLACKAALAIAVRFRGADRIGLLEECGLLPYKPAPRYRFGQRGEA